MFHLHSTPAVYLKPEQRRLDEVDVVGWELFERQYFQEMLTKVLQLR
jgi:hypothetical protein